MNKWLKLGTTALTVAVVAWLTFGVVTTFAQGPVPGYGGMAGLGGQWGGAENSLVAVAAKVLEMEQAALVAELNAGKPIAAVAQAKGIAVEQIANEFVAVRAQALQAAVTAGRLTQAQADEMLATLKTQVLQDLSNPYTPNGSGAGMGFAGANGTARPQGQMLGGRWAR